MQHPVYKPLGASTHQLAHIMGKRLDTKASHTGTLDPMASGVILVLSGKDRLRKKRYSLVPKGYRFSVVAGLQTDSYDQLGLLTTIKLPPPLDDIKYRLNKALPQFQGNITQKVPAFSAKRIGGESAFDKAKRGEEVHLESELVTVSKFEVVSYSSLSIFSLLAEHAKNIRHVSGDFRQEEIITQWKQLIPRRYPPNTHLPVITFEAEVSKRTYIRGLVRDLSIQTGVPFTTWTLERTHHGQYHIADCICLV